MFIDHQMDEMNCSLDCITGAAPVHQFSRPVKLIVLDIPTREYWCKLIVAGLIGLAYLMLGGIFFVVLEYCIRNPKPYWPRSHILVFTGVYILVLPMGVLIMNSLNGPSVIMKLYHRKMNHITMQITGVVMVAGYCAGYAVFDGIQMPKITIHSCSGFAAMGLSVIQIFFGITAVAACKHKAIGKCSIVVHIFTGVLNLIAGAVCFSSGVYTHNIPYKSLVMPLIGCCCLSTIIVIIVPMMKIMNTTFE